MGQGSPELWIACEVAMLIGAALFFVQERRRAAPRQRWLLTFAGFVALALGALVVDTARLLTT